MKKFLTSTISLLVLISCTSDPVTPDPKPDEGEKQHYHTLELVQGLPASESASGWKDYYKCSETYKACGLFWEDASGKNLIGDSSALESWKSEGGNGYIPRKETPKPDPDPNPGTLAAGSNCYIVAPGASVQIPLLRGASDTPLSSVSSAEVLWETFNTAVAPSAGDVVASAVLSDDAQSIIVNAGANDGNAVVAAKSADGSIVWSWHIWVSDYNPEENACVFTAGVLMDRNLGALSCKPADVLSFGLFYQWGRKDPFPGSSLLTNNDSDQRAACTITWPEPVESNSSKGTIDYAVSHPTTFITANRKNFDWNYTGGDNIDQTRWTFSKDPKGVYDPCPKGWRIPDGGLDGFWCKVFGATDMNQEAHEPAGAGWWRYQAGWFLEVEGAQNGGYWFPCPGQIQAVNKVLKEVGEAGYYCNAAAGNYINSMNITCVKIESWLGDLDPCVRPIENLFIGYADGQSVRCIKE